MPWKAKEDCFMLNNLLKLNFIQKINLLLTTRWLSRREKSYSISFFFWIPVLFSMFEILRTGWINTFRNFWSKGNVFPLSFWRCILLLTILRKAEATGAVCVVPKGLDEIPWPLERTRCSCNSQSPAFAIVCSPNLCKMKGF